MKRRSFFGETAISGVGYTALTKESGRSVAPSRSRRAGTPSTTAVSRRRRSTASSASASSATRSPCQAVATGARTPRATLRARSQPGRSGAMPCGDPRRDGGRVRARPQRAGVPGPQRAKRRADRVDAVRRRRERSTATRSATAPTSVHRHVGAALPDRDRRRPSRTWRAVAMRSASTPARNKRAIGRRR